MARSSDESGSGRDPQWRYIFGVHVRLTEDDAGAEVWPVHEAAKPDQPRDPGQNNPGIHVLCTEEDEGAIVWTAPLPPKPDQPPDSDGKE
jgi:hypothetical protein